MNATFITINGVIVYSCGHFFVSTELNKRKYNLQVRSSEETLHQGKFKCERKFKLRIYLFFPPKCLMYSSFRGSTVNGGTLTSTLQLYTKPLDSLEIPPKVPPRRESICIHPAKPSLLPNLVSTTNQALKPVPVQQKIPTKLAKEKDKVSKKKTHKRAQSAGQEIG